MDVRLLAVKFAHALRHDGLRATLTKSIGYLWPNRTVDPFDVANGTDTGGREPLWKLHIESSNRRYGVFYKATEEKELMEAVSFLHENLETFTFIDLGCGKGRTLVIAARLGFASVVGVEFAEELAEIAQANLAKLGVHNSIVKHADAAEYDLPSGDLVVYLYNPFSQEILQQVMEHLRAHLDHKLYVIYKVPKHAEALDSTGFLSRFGSPPGRDNTMIWKGVPHA